MQNFLSYGNDETEIDLNVNKAVLVTGVNHDASVNGELDSNGCGKSTILNAISYVLYNKTISISEKLNNLINNINQKDMLVELELSVNRKTYRISRFRKNKVMGGDGVLIEEKKSKTWKDITTTKPDPQIANDILKIPYTIFNRIIGYAAGEEPFLKQGLAKQREVIDELFDYVELSRRAEKLKDILKGYKKDLEYAEQSNKEIKEESKRHATQLENVQTRLINWNESNDDEIDKLKNLVECKSEIDFSSEEKRLDEIEKLRSSIKDCDIELDKIKQEIQYLESETEKYNNFDNRKEEKIEKLKNKLESVESQNIDIDQERQSLENYDSVSKKIESIGKETRDKEKSVNRLKKECTELENQIEHLDDNKCPYCLQQYADAKKKIDEIRDEYNTRNASRSSESDELTKLAGVLDELLVEQEKIKGGLIFDSISELDKFILTIDKIKSDIDSTQDMDNPHSDNSDVVKKKKDEYDGISEKIKEYSKLLEDMRSSCQFNSTTELQREVLTLETNREKLKDLQESKNPYIEMMDELTKYQPKKNKDKEIEQLRSDIKHCDFLIKLLTKKDSYLRKALMDKYLPLLNKRLHHYLTMMALPHKVLFNSDLSTEISQFSQEIPYGNLSAGQKARINIALSLAFRDVLQAKHNFINLFVLDECLDVGLSNVGVKKTVKAIKEVAKANKLSMFVISHRDEARDSFPDKLEIELRNGFSTITS